MRGLLRPSLHRSISIHAFREEGAPAGCTASCPVWNFYPRPPRGGRLQLEWCRLLQKHISIHALREEGDSTIDAQLDGLKEFLSTPSARRATWKALPPQQPNEISIHALREEGDALQDTITEIANIFLSTPSARRATSRWPSG